MATDGTSNTDSKRSKSEEWEEYRQKYNCLAELMEIAKIDTELLKDLLDMQAKLIN